MHVFSCMYPNVLDITWLFLFHLIALVMYSDFGKARVIVYDGSFDVDEFSDVELRFTQPIPKNGIQGVIVSADPPHACTNISRPPEVNNSLNWFVLISSNFCDYETKVIYSKLAGYSTAVIYSFRGRDEHAYMKHFRHNPLFQNISSIIIRTISGLKIKEKYLYTINESYRIFIYPNNPFNIMTFLLLFAIVAGLFLVIMLAFTIVRFIQQSQSVHNRRLSSRHLRQLQTSRYQKGDLYETCAICLEDYKDKDKLRILPCFHGYHTKCIDPWLTNNRRICPICKQKVVLSGEFNDTFDSDSDIVETTPLLTTTNRTAIHGTFNSVRASEVTDAALLSSSVTTALNSQHVPSASTSHEDEHDTQKEILHKLH